MQTRGLLSYVFAHSRPSYLDDVRAGSTQSVSEGPATATISVLANSLSLSESAPGTYTVRYWDTLSSIARKTLGDAGRWQEIYEANRDQLSNPNLIKPGQLLRIPGQAQPAPAPAPKPKPKPKFPALNGLLRAGANGQTVKVLQERLKALGFDSGAIDGDFGPRTEAAVRAFQKARGLTVDGVVGSETWNALDPNAPAQPAPMPAPAPAPVKNGKAFPLSTEQIARALGVPHENVKAFWPSIQKALLDAGMTHPNVAIAILATIKVETGRFAPIPEYASGRAYEGRRDLGNLRPGDGVRYKGRGFIQITGRANYTTYSKKLGIDLVGKPELALKPDVAAQILVQYFKDRGVDKAAIQGDWRRVRRLVNGGYNGWNTFISAVNRVKAAL